MTEGRMNTMVTELALGELTDLVVDAAGKVLNISKSDYEWKKIFVNAGKFFADYENDADAIFDDLATALSPSNMKLFADSLKSENGYELRDKLFLYIVNLLHKYEIPEDIVQSYATGITYTILNEISIVAPEKYDRYFLNDWREEDKEYLERIASKIEKMNLSLAEFSTRQVKVFSANEKDIELKRKTINPQIGIDFFEIDDDSFKFSFSEQLQNKKICVRGRSVEESIYCILNELWRIRDPRAVFVVQSCEDWERLTKIEQSGNIYIPNFIADEIVPIEKNTNIFIFTEDIPVFSNDVIDLRPRTYATIVNCLNRAGMDLQQANKLVEETHGLFVAMKKKLFNGQLMKQPEWRSKLDANIIKTCLLLGQWTECDGDKLIIESLSGISYADFLNKLLPFCTGEDPLVHIVKRRDTRTFYLSSVENTWEYFQVSVYDEEWSRFENLFFEVINENEKIYTYDHKRLLAARLKGEQLFFWSSTIRKGMLRTLLIKAGYKNHEECQEILDSIVQKIFVNVDTVEKWKYISEFFIELSEISPRIILNRLNEELNNSTGLIYLFENQDADFIMGKNHYINILFGVDEFLLQREYVEAAFSWLLRLDNLGFTYQSNSPADAFSKVLCAWYNFSAIQETTGKIRLAKSAFEIDKNAWKILYSNLPENNQTIMGTIHAPLYRPCVQSVSTTTDEVIKTTAGYLDLLLAHTECNSERWKQLIKYSDDVAKETRERIISSFLAESGKMDDTAKLIVKNSIRKLINRHRYFASASWALPESEVLAYEKLLDLISFSEPEYEYVYLFWPSHESPLLYPIPYDADDKRKTNDSAIDKLLSEKMIEFRDNKYSIALLTRLCSNMENSSLGKSLAKYWNGSKFDIDVFTTLLTEQKSAYFALDYYAGFGTQITDLFCDVMGVALKLGLGENVINGIYRVEAWGSNAIPKIAEADSKLKREFWNFNYVRVGGNPRWALEECKEYGTLNSFLHLLFYTHQNSPIPVEELFEYFDGIENLRRNSNGGDFQYYVEELIRPLQESYIDDTEKCVRIATIEMFFFHFLEWENMKCFKASINRNPKVYADLLHLIFRRDHESVSEHSDEESKQISELFSLYQKAEFCPSEFDGKVNDDDLEAWILQFKSMLEENDQASLFGMSIGRLFAFSPVGEDEHMPCEAVRNMIEKYADDSMKREYRSTTYNRRGIYSPSAGKEERNLAEKFQSNAEYMTSCGNLVTADIYYGLARMYFSESATEREDAENGRF